MPTPPPDPSRRPSSAQHPAVGRPADPAGTGPSLSDLLKSGSSKRRQPSAADLAHMLPPAANSDDAPTIISKHGHPPPPPPYVVGEAPSVAGRKLGHFELIEAIGSGGMAAVLKARDLELGRTVALKILPPESALDPENVTRFKQEARAAAKLDHENIARVYFCGEDQALHFIAFEFVEGITLRQMIDRRGVLPAGECIRYMAQVAAGLQHAADRGVVHRDIKPSNIIITPDGRAKIVDMGLARHLETSVNGGLTQSGVTLGTFDYISPEQALDPRRADVRSDIYSLGCSFYHALTGRPPVPEGTAAKKLQAHQQLDPLDPRELNPAIPDELVAVLARMMAKDPARRYQTPTDLIAHLKGVAARLNISFENVSDDSVVKAVPADGHVLPDPPRLRLGWVVAAAVVVVAVGVFAVVTSGPGHKPAPPPWLQDRAGKGDPVALVPDAVPQPMPKAGGPAHPPAAEPAADAKALAEKLRNPATTRVRLAPDQLYDLAALGEAVRFEGGGEIELAGPAGKPARVRVNAHFNFDPAAAPHPGTLTFAGCRAVHIHGVRFEVVTPPDRGEGEVGTGVAAVEVGQLTLTDCLFFADDPFRAATRSAAVYATRPAEAAEQPVRLTRCLFGPGSVGVEVGPHARLTVDDSGFAPQHGAAVVVRADDSPAGTDDPAAAQPPAAVALTRSSFMLAPGGAVVLAEGAAKVSAGGCVFAPVDAAATTLPGDPAGPRRAAVIRVPDEKLSLAAFTADGEANAYYRVDPVATAGKNYTFEDAAADPDRVHYADPKRADLAKRPWEAPDLAALPRDNPYPAFRLKLGPDADDRVYAKNPAVGVIGAVFQNEGQGGRRAYPGQSWPPPHAVVAAADVRQKVWLAGAGPEVPLGRGEYSDLVKLLRDAKSGDEILIRHTKPGPIEVEPTDIKPAARAGAERGEFKLTFRPHPDQLTPPVLTAAPGGEREAFLFRVKDGEVAFENVQFLVKPNPGSKHDTVTAVVLAGGRGATFTRCVFTLAEDDVNEAAAAVALADAGQQMMMDPAGTRVPPRVGFDRCLIRGKGRAVWAADGRSAEVDFTNTVTAVYGPVAYARAGGKEAGGAAARLKLRLSRVTAVLGGPVVELHAGKSGDGRSAGLLRVSVETDHCLFAGVPDVGRPLVEVDGVDGADPSDVRMVLDWAVKTDRQPNWYANFGTSEPAEVAAFKLADEAGTRQAWGWNQWISFAGEPGGSPRGAVTFARKPPLAGPRDLAAVKPADLAVEAMEFPDLAMPAIGDTGAEVRKLPVPVP